MLMQQTVVRQLPNSRSPAKCWSYQHQPNCPRLMELGQVSYTLPSGPPFKLRLTWKSTIYNRGKQKSCGCSRHQGRWAGERGRE